MHLQLSSSTLQGVAVVHCRGRIQYKLEAETLVREVRYRLRPASLVVLDLEDVTCVDGAGLGSLLTLHAWARSRLATIHLCNVQRHVDEVLRLTNLFDLFQIHHTLAEAVSARTLPRFESRSIRVCSVA